MADTVTNNYSLVQPQVGGDTNTWGGVLNSQTIGAVDQALAGVQAVTITTTDVTITAAQYQNAVFVVTGALTGNRSLVIPLSPNSVSVACAGRFVVVNGTSGAFSLTVKTAASGSTGVTVPQGFMAWLYSDGTNVDYCDKGLPAYALASNGDPNGVLAGTAASVNTNASLAYDYTNNLIYVCITSGDASTAVWAEPTTTIPRGFNAAINLQINASVATNVLTVALKAASTGNDPTAVNPITVAFRDVSLPAGDPVTVNVTGALSISTAVGATLGSTSNVPFRFWIVLFNNGGTPVLGLINCSTASQIYPLNESGLASSTQITSGATSAGVFYTAGAALTNKAFRILGFLTYETALVTAGTYNNAPNVVQLFGPGVKKPGEPVQTLVATTTTSTTISSTGSQTALLTGTVALTSKANMVLGRATGSARVQTNSFISAQLYRGSAATAFGSLVTLGAGLNVDFSLVCEGVDSPQTTAATQYGLYAILKSGSANEAVWLANTNSTGTPTGVLYLQELMG